MNKIKTKFKDLLVFKSKNHIDKRGYFRELLLEKLIKSKLKFYVVSKSKKNVIRGLHFQKKNPQGKFLTVIDGKILDVAVDLRRRSPTFGKYFSLILDSKKNVSIYIPPGFAHGFLCLSKTCKIYYKCTKHRDEKSENTLLWNDSFVKVKWPIKKPILSVKDLRGKNFSELGI